MDLIGITFLPVLACFASPSDPALILLISPLLVVVTLYGMPLLISILIEAAILHYRESVSWLKSFGLSLLVNLSGLVAILFGTVLSFTCVSSLSLLTLSLQGGLLGLMLITFCRRTGCFLGLTKGLRQIGFYVLLIGASYGSLILNDMADNAGDLTVVSLGVAGLLLTGFLFNLIVEGWVLSRVMPKHHPQIAATIFSMNAWSYGILPASILLSKYIEGRSFFS